MRRKQHKLLKEESPKTRKTKEKIKDNMDEERRKEGRKNEKKKRDKPGRQGSHFSIP